jgi:hypothetical protein
MSKFLMNQSPGQLHGTVRTTAVTISGGPTLVSPTYMQGRKDLLIYNPTANGMPVYIGGSDVSYSTGIPVEAGGSFGLQAGRCALYATSSGIGNNLTIRVLEVS